MQNLSDAIAKCTFYMQCLNHVCMQASVLHLIAASNRVDAAHMLLSSGIEVDALDDRLMARSSLLVALQCGTTAQCFLHICMQLQGVTPLICACVFGHVDMARCLLFHGANLSFTHHQMVRQGCVVWQHQPSCKRTWLVLLASLGSNLLIADAPRRADSHSPNL